MKNISELIKYCEQMMMHNGIECAYSDAKEIVLFACHIDRDAFFFHLTDIVSQEAEEKALSMLHERVQGTPLQYILGEWDFFGNPFFVFPGVLIPRPETEELTDMAIRYINENDCRIVYDVCSGTGCIGLSIAIACPHVQVYLFELHEKPLQCMKQNMDRHQLHNVHIIPCDVLHPRLDELPLADVLVSNPPYIPAKELVDLQREVQQEPMTALDGGDDGLVFYRALSFFWFEKLNAGGKMFFECAEGQPLQIVDLFVDDHKDVKKAFGLHDFYGNERFVVIEKF